MKKVFLLLLLSISTLIIQKISSQYVNLADQLANDKDLVKAFKEFNSEKLRTIWSENDSLVFLTFYSKVMEEQVLYCRFRMYSRLKEKQRNKISGQISNDQKRYFILLEELKELRSRFQIIQSNYLRHYVYR